VVFDEDSFPLAASSNLTDLDFSFGVCCGSPGFEPLVATLPTPAVPLRFVPRAASMTPTAPHVAQASPATPHMATPTPVVPCVALKSLVVPRVAAAPPAAMDGPPPRE
jgi:hypothetical protein